MMQTAFICDDTPRCAPLFTGKERDTETQLDYFGARFYGSAMGRFMSPDPLDVNAFRIINPQRWNLYSYVINGPLSNIDPDGRDTIAVNFSKEVPGGGHEGIVSIHADGTAQYARFGPAGGNSASGPGDVTVYTLGQVPMGANGLPTEAGYKQLATELAKDEGQDPSTVRMNYFKTSEADTAALDAWIRRMKDASDAGIAPWYYANSQNCATFTIAGLIQADAIQNRNVSLVPNRLFELLSLLAMQNYEQKETVTHKVCWTDENGKQVCQ
jgi:RHS repeat-associated protein